MCGDSQVPYNNYVLDADWYTTVSRYDGSLNVPAEDLRKLTVPRRVFLALDDRGNYVYVRPAQQDGLRPQEHRGGGQRGRGGPDFERR